MTGLEFLRHIVEPNWLDLRDHPADLRRAINAILSCDAAVGAYAVEIGKRHKDLRDEIGDISRPYGSVRDAAFALKHGDLTSVRIVQVAKDIHSCDLAWNDEGSWRDDQQWNDRAVVVMIKGKGRIPTDPKRVLAAPLVEESIKVLRSFFSGETRQPRTLGHLMNLFE
jgi:hypothetical protein